MTIDGTARVVRRRTGVPYRDDVEALAARHAVLTAEVDALERERDVAKAQLQRTKLPVLDSVRVASPCKAAWADMTGDDRVRHCAQCDRDVFDLSELTRDDAEALLLARGHLCIRYYRRADGAILLADCPVGAPRRRSRRRIATGLALVAGTAVACHEASRWVDRINQQHASETSEVFEMTAVMGEFTLDRPGEPDKR